MKHVLCLPVLCAAMGLAQAQSCPPAGARYVIKGFTGNTGVTAQGGAPDRKWGCKWQTDDGRELWWAMGPDVLPGGPAPSTAPPKGALAAGSVYRCNLPGIGLFTGAYFGIVDGSTYQNFDGKRGSYTYDEASGVLRLTSGASKGLSYRRMPEGHFRVLDDNGKLTGGSCALNKSLTLNDRW